MDGAQPLTAHERYFFDLYGYLVRYGALDDDEVDALLGAVERLDVPPPGSDLGSQRFVGFLQAEQPFRDLIDHEAILDPILEMCGPKARLDHAYGIAMTAGEAYEAYEGSPEGCVSRAANSSMVTQVSPGRITAASRENCR